MVLNIKPLSRREMARIVGSVIQRIRAATTAAVGGRTDLERLLLELISEFREDLVDLGVKPARTIGVSPWYFDRKPAGSI